MLVPLDSGWDSGIYFLFLDADICLPSYFFFFSSGKGFCSIIIYWFRLGSGNYLPFFLFFFSGKGFYFILDILNPLRSGGFRGSFFFSFYQEKGFIPLWISYFLLVQAAVPVLGMFLFLCVPNNYIYVLAIWGVYINYINIIFKNSNIRKLQLD